jgi:hypothetical protein
MDWQQLGAVDPRALGAARAEAHWAAQVIAAVGETFLPPLPDTSHTAMSWDASHAALAGAALPGSEPFRVALRLRDLTLLRLGADGRATASQGLAGTTLADAMGWAAHAVGAHPRGTTTRALVHPGYALPEHPLGGNGRFAPQAEALAELERWFANGDRELRAFAARTPGAGPVLCWPHHFDLATLVVLEADASGNATRTLGAGLSPGDASIAEPYWYVNSWVAERAPRSDAGKLPALAAGEWWSGAWTGAVLRGSELVAAGTADAQRTMLRSYLASAVEATRRLLSPPSP